MYHENNVHVHCSHGHINNISQADLEHCPVDIGHKTAGAGC